MSRECGCGCGRSLAGMRADAVWWTDACRKRAQRAPSPDKARNSTRQRKPRATIEVYEHDYGPNAWPRRTLLKKMRRAWERLDDRGG